MSNDTIIMTSPIGQRLDTMIKDDDRMLVFCGKRIPMVGKLIVGRSPSCDIVVSNSLVSKKHAMIQKIKDDFFITDLESTNGTFVNSVRVPTGKYIKIEPGDHIKVGKVVLKFQ
jgi:predicted component of type VI protein secretion system